MGAWGDGAVYLANVFNICRIKYHLHSFLRFGSIGRKYLSNFYNLRSWFKLSVSSKVEVLGKYEVFF